QHWSAELTPDVTSFGTIGAHLHQLRVDKPLLSRITLACDESFANVANYSRASSVSIAITQADDRIVVRLSDDGTPFDPLSNEPAEREFEDLEFGGMGIKFIKESCDEVSYEYAEGRNVLTMRFDLNQYHPHSGWFAQRV
ncbi:MAG: ATP-binding protein, partial [Atopobiaceae bacterium]|nr:ATP-binding protein [Atopobiaceae bacterium]